MQLEPRNKSFCTPFLKAASITLADHAMVTCDVDFVFLAHGII
jgi:hypothetical protein